jgi:Prealbumin-like fold domain
MYPKFTFRSRAGVAGALLGPGAVALMLAIAACQDEIPSAPRTPTSAASSEKGGNGIAIGRTGSGIATWDVRDANLWSIIPGGQFTLTGPNNFSRVITDNVGPEDQDAAAGSFKTMGLPAGQYQLCETVPPAHYVLPANACMSATIMSNTTTVVGQFYDYHMPRESWSVVDPVGNLLGNAYFTLYNSSLQVVAAGWDNAAAFDQDNAIGKFLTENASGSYTLCETLAPSGFIAQAPTCKVFQATPGFNPQSLGQFVNAPTYSVYFNVQDPQGNPLGGTKFLIQRAGYTPIGDIYITDNIMPDRDPTTGKYFVILPAAGDYIVCQQEAPWGYDPPSLNNGCYPYVAHATAGKPVNLGTFVDTPWPVAR